MSTHDINWPAVASWLRKEASEHVKLAQTNASQQEEQTVNIFMGLARAIDYGVEIQELAESKDWLSRVHERHPVK
jgi:hypothetical protein